MKPNLALPLLVLALPAAAQEPEAARTEIPHVRLSGSYADFAEQGMDLTSALLGGGVKPKSFYAMRGQLEGLAESEAKHVLFDLTGTFTVNFAQLAELSRSIQKVRQSGKRTIAYLENAATPQYEIAALCDEIVLADMAALDLTSVAMTVTFLKDAMDLLGVQMDVVRVGDFKGAVEPYVLSSMSRHLREHYLTMAKYLNGARVRHIAKGRKLTGKQVRQIQSKRIFTARQAKAAGLVDRLVSWRGPRHALAVALGTDEFDLKPVFGKAKRKPMNMMALFSQIMNPRAKSDDYDENTIAVLHLSGGIVDGSEPQPGSIVAGPTVSTIRSLTESQNVKGVVVRINSPGGSATASEAILLALRDLAEKKPVSVSMGYVAASGGYYVTCLGRPIFAEAGTITGSIGVFGMKPNVGPLMRRLGVHEELVALDDAAAMSSLSQPWSYEQKERMQGFVGEIYDTFVGHVARSRKLATDDVLAIAGGRVWSGEQAVERGLVDEIGGLDAAMAVVVKEAGIDDDYEVRHVPKPTDFMDLIMKQLLEARVLLGETERIAARKVGLDRALRLVLDALRSDRPTRVWALMPEVLGVR